MAAIRKNSCLGHSPTQRVLGKGIGTLACVQSDCVFACRRGWLDGAWRHVRNSEQAMMLDARRRPNGQQALNGQVGGAYRGQIWVKGEALQNGRAGLCRGDANNQINNSLDGRMGMSACMSTAGLCTAESTGQRQRTNKQTYCLRCAPCAASPCF